MTPGAAHGQCPKPTGARWLICVFVRRVFIVVAVGALVAAVWALSDILLLLFGAVLFAVILHAIAAPLQTHLGLGRRLRL